MQDHPRPPATAFGTNVVLTGAAELRGTCRVLRANILLPAKMFAGRYWTCSE
jgi:hypothetical protein